MTSAVSVGERSTCARSSVNNSCRIIPLDTDSGSAVDVAIDADGNATGATRLTGLVALSATGLHVLRNGVHFCGQYLWVFSIGALLLGSVLGAVKGFVAGRIPPADLDERDPDYIRESLPRLWLLSSLYFRGEVRGLGNIPEEGPVLLVGNHSGGNVTPDTHVFTLAFSSYFGVERRFHQLAHNLVLAMPTLGFLRKYGTIAAGHENARAALRTGAAVLVYPGGDYEVHRPSWDSAKVDFGGRKGFIKLALSKGVPIVPIAVVGAEEAMPAFAQIGLLKRLTGLIYFPITPLFPHLGLLGAPVRLVSAVGDDAFGDEALQAQVRRLAAESVHPASRAIAAAPAPLRPTRAIQRRGGRSRATQVA